MFDLKSFSEFLCLANIYALVSKLDQIFFHLMKFSSSPNIEIELYDIHELIFVHELFILVQICT